MKTKPKSEMNLENKSEVELFLINEFGGEEQIG